MGHPKLKKKTYSGPTHPWQKERIEEEKELLREFGLKNKKEVWRLSSVLRKYAAQAKKLIALDNPQAEIEKTQLLKKLSLSGLIKETAKLEDVLSITLKDILNRRLQTIIYKSKSTKSIRQARQFITHGHVTIGDKKITVPSYLVSTQEETLINFAPTSKLSNQDHPERSVQAEPIKKKEDKKKIKKKPEEKETKKDSEKKKTKAKEETKKTEKSKTTQKENKEEKK